MIYFGTVMEPTNIDVVRVNFSEPLNTNSLIRQINSNLDLKLKQKQIKNIEHEDGYIRVITKTGIEIELNQVR